MRTSLIALRVGLSVSRTVLSMLSCFLLWSKNALALMAFSMALWAS